MRLIQDSLNPCKACGRTATSTMLSFQICLADFELKIYFQMIPDVAQFHCVQLFINKYTIN